MASTHWHMTWRAEHSRLQCRYMTLQISCKNTPLGVSTIMHPQSAKTKSSRWSVIIQKLREEWIYIEKQTGENRFGHHLVVMNLALKTVLRGRWETWSAEQVVRPLSWHWLCLHTADWGRRCWPLTNAVWFTHVLVCHEDLMWYTTRVCRPSRWIIQLQSKYFFYIISRLWLRYMYKFCS